MVVKNGTEFRFLGEHRKKELSHTTPSGWAKTVPIWKGQFRCGTQRDYPDRVVNGNGNEFPFPADEQFATIIGTTLMGWLQGAELSSDFVRWDWKQNCWSNNMNWAEFRLQSNESCAYKRMAFCFICLPYVRCKKSFIFSYEAIYERKVPYGQRTTDALCGE